MRRERAIVACAVLASLALHAAWWTLSAPAFSIASRPAAMQDGPVALFEASPSVRHGRQEADLRLLLSPALFAVPGPAGFSAGASETSAATPSPIRPVTNAPAWGAREAAGADGLLADIAQRDAARPEREPPAQRLEPSVFSPAVMPTGRIVYITWYSDDGRARQFTLQPDAAAGDWVGDKPWEAVIVIDRQSDDARDRVFLETPTASAERNRALLESLLAQRARWPAGAGGHVRVRVRFDGLAAPQAVTP